MRRTFYELLDDIKFNVLEEYNELLNLFDEENSTGFEGYYHTLSEYIEKYTFRKFEYRGRFILFYSTIGGLFFLLSIFNGSIHMLRSLLCYLENLIFFGEQ